MEKPKSSEDEQLTRRGRPEINWGVLISGLFAFLTPLLTPYEFRLDHPNPPPTTH